MSFPPSNIQPFIQQVKILKITFALNFVGNNTLSLQLLLKARLAVLPFLLSAVPTCCVDPGLIMLT